MQIRVQVSINGSREEIWKVITDIETSVDKISAIDAIEILDKPESGLVGLKWRETRTMFGKSATEVMWITDVVENESYDVRAESHGMVYLSRLSISQEGDSHILSMDFGGEAQTFMGKLMSVTMGVFFKGATQRALLQDLEDLKAVVEADP
ncbi:MAG: SRPBCC family protein [Thermoanaerobaculia bacterium]